MTPYTRAAGTASVRATAKWALRGISDVRPDEGEESQEQAGLHEHGGGDADGEYGGFARGLPIADGVDLGARDRDRARIGAATEAVGEAPERIAIELHITEVVGGVVVPDLELLPRRRVGRDP